MFTVNKNELVKVCFRCHQMVPQNQVTTAGLNIKIAKRTNLAKYNKDNKQITILE